MSTFARALLLAGAEPEELATAVAATLRHAPAIAFGDVVGANVSICLVALGVGALLAPLPFGRGVFRYGLLELPVGATAEAFAWDDADRDLVGRRRDDKNRLGLSLQQRTASPPAKPAAFRILHGSSSRAVSALLVRCPLGPDRVPNGSRGRRSLPAIFAEV